MMDKLLMRDCKELRWRGSRRFSNTSYKVVWGICHTIYFLLIFTVMSLHTRKDPVSLQDQMSLTVLDYTCVTER